MAEAIEALALDDRDLRAARLFVLAGRLQATGDEHAIAEARALLVRAARDGNALAAFDLAMQLMSGRGGDVDVAAGLEWLGRAAVELPAAAAVLGGMLLFDAESAPDGIAWLRQAAAAGEASAFWLLGAAHLRGLGVAVDERQARVLLTQAAEAGVVDAQLELARLYVTGAGGARDEAAAARWEREAAEAGSPEGCLRVADRLAARAGGASQAMAWLERAANAGSAKAAERLADIYFMGREVARDEGLAERWKRRAEELAESSKLE